MLFHLVSNPFIILSHFHIILHSLLIPPQNVILQLVFLISSSHQMSHITISPQQYFPHSQHSNISHSFLLSSSQIIYLFPLPTSHVLYVSFLSFHLNIHYSSTTTLQHNQASSSSTSST